MATRPRNLNSDVTRAVREFSRRLADRFAVQTIILFGSRARGTGRPDSDADVAILLRGTRGAFLETKLEMVEVAYDILLETGIYIQPLPVWQSEWEHPEDHRNPRLLENIKREGISIGREFAHKPRPARIKLPGGRPRAGRHHHLERPRIVRSIVMKAKADSKRRFKLNTPAEDRSIRRSIKADPDTRELSAKDFALMRPFKRRRGRPPAQE